MPDPKQDALERVMAGARGLPDVDAALALHIARRGWSADSIAKRLPSKLPQSAKRRAVQALLAEYGMARPGRQSVFKVYGKGE
jgi:hypothetical protein